MGKISVHPRCASNHAAINNPLPNIMQTPSGLALLEIQGTLNSTMPNETDEDGQPAISIGTLSFPLYDAASTSVDTAWQKRVHLYVGDNQRLTGELKKLPNPVAVLRKRQPLDEQVSEELEIVDIIYHKLHFTYRPEPFAAVTGEEVDTPT